MVVCFSFAMGTLLKTDVLVQPVLKGPMFVDGRLCNIALQHVKVPDLTTFYGRSMLRQTKSQLSRIQDCWLNNLSTKQGECKSDTPAGWWLCPEAQQLFSKCITILSKQLKEKFRIKLLNLNEDLLNLEQLAWAASQLLASTFNT